MQQIITLNNWQATKYDGKAEWFSAAVPGAIQYDLVSQGKLENPYASTKAAADAAWVAKSDWLYRAEFDTPENAASMGTILLRMNGVDTYSEVRLNGTLMGETANAMRMYDFPVPPGLLAGKNTLLVRVKAHDRMIADKVEAAQCLGNGRASEGLLGKSLIRRYQRSFFTNSSLLNLGTGVLGIGINRKVELLMYPASFISDCCYRTEKIAGNAEGKVLIKVENATVDTKITVLIRDAEGKNAASGTVPAKNGETAIPLTVESPKLWWPAGYGAPYLYTMTVTVEQNGKCVQEITQEIGIRTVELVKKDETGKKTFYFKVNGKKIFVHGENYIPLDYIKSYGTPQQYENFFTLLENQGANMVRIWGGGIVEDASFFARCDKVGILIWHDLFLHSNTYPDYDSAFVKEFLAEAEGVIRQVRVHPCLCLICGGNEQQEGWDEWGWKQSLDRFYGERLVREDLPPVAARLCPDIPYIYNSPHGGKWAQSPVEGDCHNWGNFYNSTKDPTFVTETCWTQESYSRPETLKKVMGLDADDFAGKNWSAKWTERTSLPLFNRMPYSNWFEVESLRSYLHGLELEQLRADYSALSMFRFHSPANSGFIYWSMNKGGPLFQFGCVDYDGYPLMSYYAVKRLFAPVAVHAYRDISDIAVVLSSHAPSSVSVTVEAFHLQKDGSRLAHWTQDVRIEAGELSQVFRLSGLYGKVVDRTTEAFYVGVKPKGGERVVADDLLLFCPFSEYEGEYRALNTKVEKTGGNTWRLSLDAETPVRLVELESNQRLLFSDNYFPLINGAGKVIEITLLEKTAPQDAVSVTAGILGAPEASRIAIDLA